MERRKTPALATFLLVAGAALYTLFLRPFVLERVRAETLAPEFLFVAPVCLLAVVVWLLIAFFRDRKSAGYNTARALMRLGFAALLMGFLMPSTFGEYRARKSQGADAIRTLESLAQHRDARVRALVMEVSVLRGKAALDVVQKGLSDKDPLVQQAARETIKKWDIAEK